MLVMRTVAYARKLVPKPPRVLFLTTVVVILGVTIVLAIHFSLLNTAKVHLENAYEDVAYTLMPSAERAFVYGERHFNAMQKGEYDVARAKYFSEETRRLDPDHSLVHHELARISFLEGNQETALYRITTQIEKHGSATASSYYVRGLIEGFLGKYADSARDYETYLKTDPTNWAALTDYSWVLLKSGRIHEALDATSYGLNYFPDNPWLLNANAIALYELGKVEDGLVQIRKAQRVVSTVTEEDWLKAYPGNDPRMAGEGVRALQDSIIHNMHTMNSRHDSGELQ